VYNDIFPMCLRRVYESTAKVSSTVSLNNKGAFSAKSSTSRDAETR
jgi:hypothetical protein